MSSSSAQLTVLVKASPVLTSHLEETMCVAGVRTDLDAPAWIRLHPVPFRDLLKTQQFAKYQEVSVQVLPPVSDRRPESFRPIEGSMTLGGRLSAADNWAARRALVAGLGEVTMCQLVAANRAGSGPETPSLAVVRLAAPPKFLIAMRDADQIEKWQQRADAVAGRLSLFESSGGTKPFFEVVRWRFSYRYKCLEPDCRTHTQTIVDWEAEALWRNVRHHDNWRELMTAKFEHEMWHGRDSLLFVGNQEQHPHSFLVLGVFWPPDVEYQRAFVI